MAHSTPHTLFGILFVWLCSIGTLQTMDLVPSEEGFELPQAPLVKLPRVSKNCNVGEIVNRFSVERTTDDKTDVKVGCQMASYKRDSLPRIARIIFNIFSGVEHLCPPPTVIGGILFEPKGILKIAAEISCVQLLTTPLGCDWSHFKLFRDMIELSPRAAFTGIKYKKGRLEFKVCKI